MCVKAGCTQSTHVHSGHQSSPPARTSHPQPRTPLGHGAWAPMHGVAVEVDGWARVCEGSVLVMGGPEWALVNPP